MLGGISKVLTRQRPREVDIWVLGGISKVLIINKTETKRGGYLGVRRY